MADSRETKVESPQQLVTTAASDLRAAEDLLDTGDTLWACSAAAEAGRKSLEGLVSYFGREAGEGSLPVLAREVAAQLGATSPKLERAAIALERYEEIAERESPEEPDESEAKAVLAAARRMLELARGIIGLD